MSLANTIFRSKIIIFTSFFIFSFTQSCTKLKPIKASKSENSEGPNFNIVGANADSKTTALARKSTVYLHPIFCTGTLVDLGIAGYERKVVVTAAHCKC